VDLLRRGNGNFENYARPLRNPISAKCLRIQLRQGMISLVRARLNPSMTTVKTRISLTLILLLAGLGLWWGIHASKPAGKSNVTPGQAESHGTNPAGSTDDPQGFRTKASNREISDRAATHRPERLKEFMLPEIAIDGLDLDAALRKLLAVYQDACRKTGETALDLKFVVPPGTDRKLHLRLGSRSFKSSVQLLATVSGMKVSRDGMEYRFAAIQDKRTTVKRTLNVPPDFQSVLGDLKDGQAAQAPVLDLINRLGIELDPSTRLTLGADGKLAMETH
jgi:hypothetical protein